MYKCDDCGLEFLNPIEAKLLSKACPGKDCECGNIYLIDPTEEQEGKSLDELAGEGHIATPETDDERGMVEIDKEGNEVKVPTTEEEIMKPVDFKTGIFGMRSDIELVKSKVKNWVSHPQCDERFEIEGAPETRNIGEMTANLMLAYRHLEDARMRLGKAVQAFDMGIYPR